MTISHARAELFKGKSFLTWFSKLVCFSTLFLIFAGGMVTSTNSGLSVPDWPLSYGMIFPPMVGGVFYEHGHRMVASFVGFLTLSLTIALWWVERRKWVKFVALSALGAVILQGILGGLTVLFFLPKPISIAHGVLAQTFFVLTIILAYGLSQERRERQTEKENVPSAVLRLIFLCAFLVYVQLVLGALMRHTDSGLAIPDFPTMGGNWIPTFDSKMLASINNWRFDYDFPPVTLSQVVIHFAHRAWAFFIVVAVCFLNYKIFKSDPQNKRIVKTLYCLNILLFFQLALGIFTVLSGKAPVLTSFHVVTGAATLGICVLMFLRAAPLSWGKMKCYLF